MAINIGTLIIKIIVELIVIAPVLWLAGRALVGGQKARYRDAIYIVVAGVLIGAIFGYFLTGWVSSIVSLIVWLVLIKHYFDASWGKSLVIGILAVVILIVISIALAFILGFGIYSLLL
jgi:hypothetical protein